MRIGRARLQHAFHHLRRQQLLLAVHEQILEIDQQLPKDSLLSWRLEEAHSVACAVGAHSPAL